ncbi:MAG: T9SS type A sorting domain-containing protein [Bacteroidota bacterium]
MVWKKQRLFNCFFGILLSVFSVQQANAQAALGIGTSGLIGFPDTVLVNQIDNFDLYLKNTGTQAYSGNFSIKYSVNTNTQPNPIYSGFTPGLNPGDSILLNINNFQFYHNPFIPESENIVVVWPLPSVAAPVTDSIKRKVYVTNPANIANIITAMPMLQNPSDIFTITIRTGNLSVKATESYQLQIWDLLGNIIYQSGIQRNQSDIDLSSCSKGIYLLKLQSAEKTHVEKIIIQ